MHLRFVMIALLGCADTLVGCGARPVSPAAAAVTWLEVEGARMLVTTTRAARGGPVDALPMLIVLPSAGSTPAEALAEVGYVDIEVPARVVAIEGFEPDGAGSSWWRRTRPAPDDPDRDAELVGLLTDRASRLAALVDVVRRRLGAASPPVVSGISQGGDLSIALGLLHPADIAAALPIAARFPAPLWPRPAEPGTALPLVDAFQGTADRVAPVAALERASAALRGRGYPVVIHTYDGVAHEVSPAERADVRACAALRLRGSHEPCL